MGFTMCKQVPPGVQGLGISVSVSVSEKTGVRKVNFFINRAAQERFFGKTLDPETDKLTVAYGSDEDAGAVQIMRDNDGDVRLQKSMHGAIKFSLQPFVNVPTLKEPGAPCILRRQHENTVEVWVPWARQYKLLAGQRS